MIETNSAFISKLDDNTAKVIIKSNALLSEEEYNSFEEIYYNLMGSKGPFKFIIILEHGARIKKNVTSFFKKDYKTDFKMAEAYLIKDPVIKMFFRVGQKILKNRRNYPVKEFNTEQDALSWLKSLEKL